MTDERDRLTDPEELAGFGQRVRAAAIEALREDNPLISDDELAAILEGAGPPSVIAVIGRYRKKGTRETRTTDKVSASTSDELASLRRRLPGGANQGGRSPGTNTVEDAGGDAAIRGIVAALKRDHRRVKLDTVAAASGTFTTDQLRYWLRVNGKRLRDY